jgi:Family of unknown function (DUF6174)
MKKVFLALFAALSLASAKSTVPAEPVDQTLKSLEASYKLWLAHKPAKYQLTVQRSCYCAPRQVTAVFDVLGASSKWKVDKSLTDRSGLQSWVSIDRLYKTMRTAINDNGRVAVVFGKNGVPEQIILDPLPTSTDDEKYLTITMR